MSEKIRLQKYMAECGVASRRACETIITEGRVTVNGLKTQELGTKIDPDYDEVCVDGNLIKKSNKKYYIMLNKPSGYITSASDQFGRKTVLDLISNDISERLYPVGRLDYDTEGLLLLTNDGDFAHKLTHPSKGTDKTYIAVVSGTVSKREAGILSKGVLIDGKKTAPAKVSLSHRPDNTTEITITIHEGRNRQIRKMCSAISHEVLYLKRVAIGDIFLGNLPMGKWRHLNPVEINKLLK
ncbi:MAG: rRNA pseudouridine synthase [Ruminococcaceae bacterium]|nr:rRNA pseudouridine synthase [Oscillospiraceae bacterium]